MKRWFGKVAIGGILLVAGAGLSACTDSTEATRILKSNGYSNIQITGYDFFTCSEDDFYHTGFRAVGPTGLPVRGTVCSGFIFKNSTIRFN